MKWRDGSRSYPAWQIVAVIGVVILVLFVEPLVNWLLTLPLEAFLLLLCVCVLGGLYLQVRHEDRHWESRQYLDQLWRHRR